MPLILPGNVGSATAATELVSNSCRFNDGDTASLSKTPSSNGSNTVWTVSMWCKRSHITTDQKIHAAGTSATYELLFSDADQLTLYNGSTTVFVTNRVFRDVSAWLNVVVSYNTGASGTDKCKLFINGTLETSFATDNRSSAGAMNHINQSSQAQFVGNNNAGNGFDGYIAEVCVIDGTALVATSFGEFDSDSEIWKPIDVSGLTFGTNGFYLDFEDSSNLGNDVNGGTDLTANNLAAIDQSTDNCINNFAVMNSIDNYFAGSTFSEGNLKVVTTGGNITYNTSTIGFSSGKWYMETKLAGSAGYTVGVVRGVATANDNGNKLGNRADGWSYDDGGDVEHNGGSLTGSFASYSSGDIIGVYADLDNNELYFSKNGTLQNSGTGLALTAGTYFFAVGDNNASNSSTYEVNFGGTNTYSVSSGNTDGTYGNFEYSTTITGDGASKIFKALNTKNLAEFG
tara:strand:- start:366 stop:1736 length:1371 start_codon:yes stop_codon:yes gene_type:complete